MIKIYKISERYVTCPLEVIEYEPCRETPKSYLLPDKTRISKDDPDCPPDAKNIHFNKEETQAKFIREAKKAYKEITKLYHFYEQMFGEDYVI
jgi:hypothetical protein